MIFGKTLQNVINSLDSQLVKVYTYQAKKINFTLDRFQTEQANLINSYYFSALKRNSCFTNCVM